MLSVFANGSLFGERFGDGLPWVLALHGWGRSSADFRPTLQSVPGATDALSAIALDLPGFGASPAPPEAWGSQQYAEAVAPVLEEMGPKIVLLGHSFGGRVAVHLAAAAPERVAALVLSGVPLLRPTVASRRPPLAYRFVRSAHRLGLVGDERMERARRSHGSSDYRTAAGVIRDVLVRVVNEDYLEVVRQVSCPVELLWGEQDTSVPLGVASHAADLFPGMSLTTLAGVGHLTPTEAPAALRGALERLRP